MAVMKITDRFPGYCDSETYSVVVCGELDGQEFSAYVETEFGKIIGVDPSIRFTAEQTTELLKAARNYRNSENPKVN